MQREKIIRADKDLAAVHEAGHLTVALALGSRGSVTLGRQGEFWTGSFLSADESKPSVAIAGTVAECLIDQPGVKAVDLADQIEDDFLLPSPIDMRNVPQDFGGLTEAITDALELLADHRSFFDWAVAELVAHEAISEEAAWDRFHSRN